jgi:hypothetical protein
VIFGRKVLRRISGPKRERGYSTRTRKLLNEELHNLYSWTNITSINKLGGEIGDKSGMCERH